MEFAPTVTKVVLTGVESTGKSTLAAALATRLQTVWVPEYAREYLTTLNRPYQQEDLVQIARGQLAAEARLLKKANRYLFCDTGMLVLKIWSEYKYGGCDPFIIQQLNQRESVYILCGLEDISWEYDPLRENPGLTERQHLHTIYQKELEKLSVPYVVVTGNVGERVQRVVNFLTTSIK